MSFFRYACTSLVRHALSCVFAPSLFVSFRCFIILVCRSSFLYVGSSSVGYVCVAVRYMFMSFVSSVCRSLFICVCLSVFMYVCMGGWFLHLVISCVV